MTFAPGATITVREVLHGQVWLELPETVVSDDEVLATLQVDGTPLTFHDHPFGPHPWSHGLLEREERWWEPWDGWIPPGRP